MTERTKLAALSVITDDDTGLYFVGELDGGFQQTELTQFLTTYGRQGRKDLLEHLAYMQHKVIETYRSIRDAKETQVTSETGDTNGS